MKIEPTKNNLFIEVSDESNVEAKTEGGIVLPKTDKDHIFIVTYAGPNDFDIKPGDKVILNPNANYMEFRVGTKMYKFVTINHVLGLVT